MRIRLGKELTQLEIINRLNLMGIKYDPSITGKNYYINLYNKGVASPSKIQKIKAQLEKDSKYFEYLSNNLRKTKENSIYFIGEKNDQSINPNKKCFFGDFNSKLYNTTLLCYSTFNFLDNNKNTLKNVKFPVDTFKKLANSFVYPEFKELLRKILDYFGEINLDKYHYLYIIVLIGLMLVLIIFFIKYKKGKNSLKI